MKPLHLLLAIGLSGCFGATIHLAPVGPVGPPAISEAWHVGIFGVYELSDPVALGGCPAGVANIEEHQSLLSSLIAGFLGVDIMDTTVNCMAGAAQPPGPPPGVPPPGDTPPSDPPPPE